MQEIWNAALRDLQTKVSAHNFETWFKKIRLHHCEERRAFLEVDDDFFKAWIEDNYMDLIEDALRGATGESMEVVIDIEGSFDGDDEELLEVEETRAAARSARIDGQTALFEFTAPPVKDLQELVTEAGMNPRYTFDEFVVGSSNQFTYAACQAVATTPAQTYNPLFIFGGVGLGKTHLLQAIGVEILKRDPHTRVMYLSSEEFMNQLITSLRKKDMNTFRNQFRNDCDLLLVDDIQFIGGKDSTQEEFFHTFNALYQSGKQIVVTSDKSPKELPGIEERLASRFSWGLIADIQPPEIETRVAILEKKAEADGLSMTQDVAMLIASTVRSNVRELEGTLIRLGAQAKLMGTRLTLDFARTMLKRMNLDTRRQVGVQEILRATASHFDITVSDIKGPRRTRAISEPRQIAMYLSRKHTNHSYPELGRRFGGKDHTTVLAACKKLEDLVATGDNDFARSIQELESILFGR